MLVVVVDNWCDNVCTGAEEDWPLPSQLKSPAMQGPRTYIYGFVDQLYGMWKMGGVTSSWSIVCHLGLSWSSGCRSPSWIVVHHHGSSFTVMVVVHRHGCRSPPWFVSHHHGCRPPTWFVSHHHSCRPPTWVVHHHGSYFAIMVRRQPPWFALCHRSSFVTTMVSDLCHIRSYTISSRRQIEFRKSSILIFLQRLWYPESWDRSSVGGGECERDIPHRGTTIATAIPGIGL